jgi:hypothetical protein
VPILNGPDREVVVWQLGIAQLFAARVMGSILLLLIRQLAYRDALY